jgi:hypothetical protein
LPPPLHHKNLKIKKPKKINKNNAFVSRKILYTKIIIRIINKNASVAGCFVHIFAALYFSPKKMFSYAKRKHSN